MDSTPEQRELQFQYKVIGRDLYQAAVIKIAEDVIFQIEEYGLGQWDNLKTTEDVILENLIEEEMQQSWLYIKPPDAPTGMQTGLPAPSLENSLFTLQHCKTKPDETRVYELTDIHAKWREHVYWAAWVAMSKDVKDLVEVRRKIE